MTQTRIDADEVSNDWSDLWVRDEVIGSCPTLDDFLVQWGLSQRNFNTLALNHLESIFNCVNEAKNRNDFLAQEKSVRSVFDEINKIGKITGNRALEKIAEAGHNLVNLSLGISGVCSQLSGSTGALASIGTSMPALSSCFGPIAALQPALLIVGAGFALASLCGFGRRRRKKGSGNEPIVNAMQEIHKAVLETYKAVIEVHKDVIRVYELVAKLGDYLIEEVKLPIMDKLSVIDTNCQRSHIISVLEHREIFLQSFEILINRMDDYADGIIMLDDRKLNMLLTYLHDWMGREKSCSALLTGRNFAQTGVTEHEPQWVKQVLSNPNNNLTNLIGFLAIKAEQLAGKELEGININSLMNLQVWVLAVKTWLHGLGMVDLKQYYPVPVFDEILSQIENYEKFIQFVATSEELYKGLFDVYEKSIQLINAAIERKFVKLRSNPPNKLPDGALTLEQIFSHDSGDRKELDQYLDMLDDFHMLFASYSWLGGLNQLQNDSAMHLLTREKIFSYKADFYNRISNGPSWGNAQGFSEPQHYGTIRTAIFSFNDKPVLATLARLYWDNSGVAIELYDLSVQPMRKLEGVPQGKVLQDILPHSHYKLPFCYQSISMNVIATKEKPEIYVMARSEFALVSRLYSYDLQTGQWRRLSDVSFVSPDFYKELIYQKKVLNVKGQSKLFQLVTTNNNSKFSSYTGKELIYQKEVLNVNGQSKLFQLVTTNNNSKFSSYDTGMDKWDTALPARPGSALLTNVIEINGQQMFCKVSVSNKTHFCIDIYNPDKNEWLDPVLEPIGIQDYDEQSLRAAVLATDGVQKLYFVIWHPKGLHLTIYNPATNSFSKYFTLLAESPFWQFPYKMPIYLQTIKLNGQYKLLVMARHSMGYQKHLYHPSNNTWEHVADGDWPHFKDVYGWNKKEHYSTIQAHVLDVSPDHQELFICGRSDSHLHGYRVKIAPPDLFKCSHDASMMFLEKLREIKTKPLEINPVFHMIKIQIELWKKKIEAFVKLENLKETQAVRQKGDELQKIINNAVIIHKYLTHLCSFLNNTEEKEVAKLNGTQILEVIKQLRINQIYAVEQKLLIQLIASFNAMDTVFNVCFEDYKLSQNVHAFLKTVKQYMKSASIKNSFIAKGYNHYGVMGNRISTEELPKISVNMGHNILPFKLVNGFSQGESTHRWTEGRNASLVVPKCIDGKSICQLVFETSGLISNRVSQTLIVSGKKVEKKIYQYHTLNPSNKVVIDIPIDDTDNIEINFEMPQCCKPCNVNPANLDIRELAIAFKLAHVYFGVNCRLQEKFGNRGSG